MKITILLHTSEVMASLTQLPNLVLKIEKTTSQNTINIMCSWVQYMKYLSVISWIISSQLSICFIYQFTCKFTDFMKFEDALNILMSRLT